MKISNVIKELSKILCEHGDLEVKMSLLSENGDVDFDKFTIGEWVGFPYKSDHVCITYDINSMKEFKKVVKDNLDYHK